MKLMPSLKQKKRYVLFAIDADAQFTAQDVYETTMAALKDFLGELGLSKASPIFVKEQFKQNQFIYKVNHNYTDELISGIILIKSIKNKPVIIRSITISGTLKKACSKKIKQA